MTTIDVTIVRLRKTREPVAVFEQVDDLIELGRRIDEVTDPADCEYADETLAGDFSILFPDPAPDFHDCEESALEVIESASLCSEWTLRLEAMFRSEEVDWTQFPQGLNCLSTNPPLEDRFRAEKEYRDMF